MLKQYLGRCHVQVHAPLASELPRTVQSLAVIHRLQRQLRRGFFAHDAGDFSVKAIAVDDAAHPEVNGSVGQLLYVERPIVEAAEVCDGVVVRRAGRPGEHLLHRKLAVLAKPPGQEPVFKRARFNRVNR